VIPNHVQVWKFTQDTSDDASAFGLLDEMERARALRYSVEIARKQFIAARAFLRQALGNHLGIPAAEVDFRYSNHGKPALAGDDDCRFNLSHSGDAVVLAITHGRDVGIDVEARSRFIDARSLAKRFFSHAEAEWVLSHSEAMLQQAFFTCWTGKEAYIKARGDGLSFPLDAFQVIPAEDGATLNLEVYADPEETGRWSMQQLQLGAGLTAAISVEGSGWTMQVSNWSRSYPY
jgi:4'-phosphopantetheinyl transferase